MMCESSCVEYSIPPPCSTIHSTFIHMNQASESPRTSAMLCSHGPSMVQFHHAMGGMPTGATRRASGGSSISDRGQIKQRETMV
jgi:hypothetical protein